MTAIRDPSAGSGGATSGVGVLARYAYAETGNLATLTRGNGTTTSVQVDGVGRLASLSHDLAGTAQDWQAGFAYTPSGQIASRSQTNDAAYAWRGHYNVARPYTANGLNQLTTAGPLTLSYVNVSNLKSDGTWTYNYDTENKLRKVTRPGVVVQLNYDPFDRLFVTIPAPGVLTKFLYDGNALIGEYDTTDALVRRTVHGPGVDAPLVSYDAAGTRRWLHADERGSVVAESDASGQAVATYAYGPWGELDTTAGGRFRYTGQALIPELGLYYYKARMYSAYLGRFLQTDPAGYADGLNLYAYAGGDPINATDPSGLFKLSPSFHSSFLSRFEGGAPQCPNGELDCGSTTGSRGNGQELLEDIRTGAFRGGGSSDLNERSEKENNNCPTPPSPGAGKSTIDQNIADARLDAKVNALDPFQDPFGVVEYLNNLMQLSFNVTDESRQNYKANPAFRGSAPYGNFNFGATMQARGFSLKEALGITVTRTLFSLRGQCCVFQQIEIKRIFPVLEEGSLPPVAALRDVMRVPGKHNARKASHRKVYRHQAAGYQ